MKLQLAPALADREMPAIDALADRLQPAVRAAIDGSGPITRNFLDGVWLGVPLHPPLTDIPIGAAVTATVLDGWGVVTRSTRADQQADGALAVSVAGALGAIATGLAEWRWLRAGRRRAATVHGVVNLVGMGFERCVAHGALDRSAVQREGPKRSWADGFVDRRPHRR